MLSLFAHFHPEPEKMLTDMRSWLIARVTNSVVGSLAVTVWFLVSFSLIGSLVLSVLFAVLLSTNWILVQNSATNMPEQWLLLLVGLTFLILTQKRGHFPLVALSALTLSFLIGSALGSPLRFGSLYTGLAFGLLLPLPFWWLFITIAWLSNNRSLVSLFAILIAVSGLVLLIGVLQEFFSSRIAAPLRQLYELLPEVFIVWLTPLLLALPFILLVIFFRFRFGWEGEDLVWSSIGGAVASLAFHAHPEGLLIVSAFPFLLQKANQRMAALTSWLLGLTFSLSVFWLTNLSLPAGEWLLTFRVLDFQTDRWHLYGQQLPTFGELIATHWGDIVKRVLAKFCELSVYLLQSLGLLWLSPLLVWRLQGRNFVSHPLDKSLFLAGLLLFAVHWFVWSTPAEPRLVSVPTVLLTKTQERRRGLSGPPEN